MALNLSQIDALTAQAAALGLDAHTVEGVRTYLLHRAAQLDGAGRFDLAFAQLPKDEANSVSVFLDEMTALRQTVMDRGRTALAALSEDEWNAYHTESDVRGDDGPVTEANERGLESGPGDLQEGSQAGQGDDLVSGQLDQRVQGDGERSSHGDPQASRGHGPAEQVSATGDTGT
jgi:hypothetical protein